MDRYTIRADRDGFSVYDAWTGEIAIIATGPQRWRNGRSPRPH
jgi:hypothetical protein